MRLFCPLEKAGIVIRKEDWKTEPIPEEREELGYDNFFSDSDVEKIMAGHKPEDMDDKWFIYSENGWVYFVRSWTGIHIFAFQLEASPDGAARVVSSWVNANQDQYRSQGKKDDIQLINNLIKSRLGVEGLA